MITPYRDEIVGNKGLIHSCVLGVTVLCMSDISGYRLYFEREKMPFQIFNSKRNFCKGLVDVKLLFIESYFLLKSGMSQRKHLTTGITFITLLNLFHSLVWPIGRL